MWWKMRGSWGRETGGMLQGIGTAGRSFRRMPWLKRGRCANDDDDDDDDGLKVVYDVPQHVATVKYQYLILLCF